MKKLLVFLFIVLLLCGMNLSTVQNLTINELFPNASVEVFMAEKTDINCLNKIDNGFGEIIFCYVNDLNYILKNYNNVAGLTLKINKNVISKTDLLGKLCIEQKSEENFGIYGWSRVVACLNGGRFCVNLSKNKCNFQLFEDKNIYFLGFPLILGSY